MFGYDWPRLHAALNDLPAALLLMAVLFDLAAAVVRRPSLRTAGFWTLLAGTLGAAVAVLSGLQAEDHIAHGDAVHQVMETHEELALITLGIFAVLAVWRIARERRMGAAERGVGLALSVGGAAVLVATGVYGGKLVFDHAAGIPTEVLQSEIRERMEGSHHHGGGTDGGAEHEHPAPAEADTTAGPAAPATVPAGHTHAPGTPPHQD